MNNHDQLESLPLDDLERIDATCDALASAWKRGLNPSIEEMAQAAPESLRALMVAELVRTEIELRLSAGERPTAEEYVSRFPQWSAELHALFAQLPPKTPDFASPNPMAPTLQLSAKDTADDFPLTALHQSTAVSAASVVGLDESVMHALRNRYEIRDMLGRGGMGVVVKARDTKLDREVALKLLAPELARDETAKQRFLREARAAAAVKHDNVVTIYSADEINDVPLLEMELIEGESLAERIKRDGALPADEVARLAIQIARGLEAAHRRGLIHRDIKPANILLEKIDSIVSRSASAPGIRDAADSPQADATRLASGSFSRVKITDFGLARVTADATITHSGFIAGTPQYMSPEQAEAKPLDHRTDLFSFGSVMYSMCTGQSAFQAESALVTLRLVSDSTPPAIREINPGVPTWLVSIIERLMAKNPDDRFQSAAEVAEALTRAASSPTQASIAIDRASARTTAGAKLIKWSWLVPAVVIVVVVVGVVLRNQPVTTQGDSHALGERGYDKRDDSTHSDVGIGKNKTDETPDANTKPPSTNHPLVSSEFEWTEPENLGPNINTESSEDHACVSSDGLQLIFVRRQNGAADLWSSVRTNPSETWGVAQRMPDGINSLQQDQTPFLSADGLSLWFASDRIGGSGKSDLYVSRRETPDGAFGPATPLGAPINTPDDEASPFVSADGLTLLFGRGVPRQLFQATRPKLDAPFGTPKVLANVNSGQWQEFPRLTQDGLHLLFVGSTNGFNNQGLVIASRNRITDDFYPPKSLGSMFHVGVVSGPSLSSDESTIYFSAKRGGLNHHDLWVTRRVPKPELVMLAQAATLPSVTEVAGLKLGDLDGDGDLDLFIASLKKPCVVLHNDGTGRFTDSGQELGRNSSFAVALGDLDSDGDLDAFVANSDNQENAIWLNDGRGTFQRSPQSFPPNSSNDVALADLDGDKDLDVVVSNWTNSVEIWINAGSGQFTSQQTIARRKNTGLALGDIDGDGDADLIVTSFLGDNQAFLNDGQGNFTESDSKFNHPKSSSAALGDLDLDGDLDLFITTHQGSQIWFNDGRGSFEPSQLPLGDGECETVELIDLDADHDLDAVTIGGGFGIAAPRIVWLNDGSGRFQIGPPIVPGISQSLAVGDLDRDGAPDVVFGNLSQPAEVWLNQNDNRAIAQVQNLGTFSSPDGLPLPAVAPFGSRGAREFQKVWAKHLNVDVRTTNSIGMKLSLIPPGEFLMGATDDDPEGQPQEKPQHKVRLTKPFWIGTTEVTVGQFRRFVEATKYVTQAESDGQGAFDIYPKVRRPNHIWSKMVDADIAPSDEYPVRCVSWEDARHFCEWLSKTEGRTYRLPTDAEWEFACRAGTQTRYSFGNDFDEAKTNATRPGGSPLQLVAHYPANPFGLFDMHGNLNEICWDSGRTFTTDPVTDPLGSIELDTPAVVRGGAISSSPARLRSSQRYLSDARRFPEENFATIVKGFRVVAVIEMNEKP